MNLGRGIPIARPKEGDKPVDFQQALSFSASCRFIPAHLGVHVFLSLVMSAAIPAQDPFY
jgi:hypothetical protein